MLKQLKYIEGSSNKFWNIETQGNSFTVTYGKIGTQGVSKTKQFEDEANCLKEAEKLIAEKIKKGYSESGEVTLAKPATSTKNNQDNGISKQQVLDLYDQILETNNIEGLLSFLQQYSKGHITELKKHLKKARKYWLDYVELEVKPVQKSSSSLSSLFKPEVRRKWGIRGNKTTEKIICLTALALLNETEAKSWDNLIEYLKHDNDPNLLAVLQWSKPDWISAYLLDRRKKDPWNTLSYKDLRSLEDKGYVQYQPELFALTLAQYNDWRGTDKHVAYSQWLLADQYALKRDMPLLFVYETDMHGSNFRFGDGDSNELQNFWDYLFDRAFNEQLLDPKVLCEQALLTQTKNWNNPLKAFFRQQIKRAELSHEDIIALQDVVFGLLRSDQSAVVNFAIELLKPALWEKGFKLNAFLDELPAVMIRDDCKGSVKILLIELDKLAKKDKIKQQALCLLAADVFVIPQLTLQERAAKFIIKYGHTKNTELVEKIQLYQDQLLGTLKTELAAYLTTSGSEESSIADLAELEEPCCYLYQTSHIQHLLAENKVVLPTSWDEILYSVGRFMQSTDPIDSELLMYAVMCCRHLFPEDANEQFKPYIKQLKNIQGELYFRHVLGACFAFILEESSEEFGRIYQTESAYISISCMKYVYTCINKGYKLPLLSLPTHQPHWVEPKALVERLIAYEHHKQPIDWLDLSIAISRMPKENTEEALALTKQLSNELALLIRFCLADKTIIEQRQQPGVLGRLFNAGEIRLIEGVWATAARTFYPEHVFEVFDNGALQAIPFAKEPWQPEFNLVKRSVGFFQGEVTDEIMELVFSRPASKKSVISFLYTAGYSHNFYDKPAYYDLWYFGDIRYFCSLMPQYQESTAMLALKYCGKSADANGSSIKEFLETCLDSSFIYRSNALWVLVCGLLKKKKETRLLAIEVLIKSIEEQRLPLEESAKRLIKLIQGGYAPLGRLVEALAALKDISALHNDALLQWLEIMFGLIAKKQPLPNHFKKMLEIYFDLLVRLQRVPADELIPALTQWQEQKSLASLLKKINQLKASQKV